MTNNRSDIGKVGVLLGGKSSEAAVSVRSGRAVAAALRARGYDVVEIGEDGDIEGGLMRAKIDIAFIVLHGAFGEDGRVQALLEGMNIPYTGSGPDASRIAFDKIAAKRLWAGRGIVSPEFEVVTAADVAAGYECRLNFPLAVKPAREGSSFGFSKASDKNGLDAAVRNALRYDDCALVERFIPGLELTVGVVCGQALPVIHIVPRDGCYDYEHKYTKGMTEYIVPADIPDSAARELGDIALRANDAIGCRDMARADFILAEGGRPYILEINTVPGFTETSLLPKAAAAVGMDFGALCEKILSAAFLRAREGA